MTKRKARSVYSVTMPTPEAIEHRLLSRGNPFGQGEPVVLPDYEGYSIAGINSLVHALFGLPHPETPMTALSSAWGPTKRVVLLVLDGLGYRRYQSLVTRHPNCTLGRLASRGSLLPLSSVYPCTTVSALSSISTGAAPAEHGLIGYRLYLRETQAITNMIRFTVLGNDRPDSAFAVGLDPADVLPCPTLHQQLESQGVSTHSMLASYIAHSGLSKALYEGSTSIHSSLTFADMLVKTRELINASAGPTFASLYWSTLDSIAHVRGPLARSYEAEFCALNTTMEREWEGQLEDTLLLVTADHGFVPMAKEDYLDVATLFDADGGLVLPPVGEPRASYLHARESACERIRASFAEDRSDGLICVTAEEILDAGLLGNGARHPELRHRLGDLAVLSTGSAGLYHDYPDGARLRGMHGGLTEDEMLVPLLVAPC